MTRFYSLMGILLLFCTFLFAQSKQITGRVTDQKDGSPLPGVTVKIKNGAVGTVTASDGTYKLDVPAKGTTLVFSFVGYDDKEVIVGSQQVINAELGTGNKELSEVVVVGYGTQTRRNLTGSISKVTAKEIANLPLPTFETALQGRAPGVFINSGSGRLGEALNIRIRGISSVTASNDPLIIIDGIPVVSQTASNLGAKDNPLASINPDDIASMEVLKDAAAAAIYGARASNGVILVTTKSGKAGRTKINASVFGGLSEPTRKGKWLNAQEYRELFNEAAKNSDIDLNDEMQYYPGGEFWKDNYDENWSDHAFQHGNVQQYSLSMSGGNERTTFYLNGSYNNQKGILIGNRLNRANGRLNIDHSINDKIKVGANISLSKTNNYRLPDDNAFSNPLQLVAIPPFQPKIDPLTGKLNTRTLYYNNLLNLENNSNTLNTLYRSISSIYGTIDILPYLNFRSEVGIDYVNSQDDQYLSKETQDGAPDGYGYNAQTTIVNYNTNNYFTFKKHMGEFHDLEAVAGMSYQSGKTNVTSVEGRGFPSNQFVKLTSSAKITSGATTVEDYTFLSYFLRANYRFKDKYLLGASIRYDGSSRFGSNTRYGAFPAVSAGWIISQEDFLHDSKAVSNLKLRASYGLTGNAEIGNYKSRTLYSGLPYGSISGIFPTQIGSSDLSWESTRQADIGLEFGFLKDRITGEVDYFSKNTRDLLLDFPLPGTNGFNVITKNLGALTNKGWEASITTQNLVGKFQWSTTFNISTYRNKVTNLNGATISGGSDEISRISEGRPFGYFYGKKYMGVDEANGDALYMTKDGKTTNDYGAAVDTVIGNPNPDFYGGFGNHFSYKGFDLDVQCQFVKGNDLYNMAGHFQSVNGDYFDNQTRDQLNRWQKPGDKTDVPQARLYAGNGTSKSSRWVQDGSYFRVKTVTLGYNIPKPAISRLKIDNARIYVSAVNLFTATKYKGYDPELNTASFSTISIGHDFYTPPQARTITIGINIGL
ncbi:TonB-dependent receptor [Chitinophaga sp. OAE865]|uniref:SusC/RagA family TonB-linked outer membrane protein n=1 Tax=Chitinophaga sp. OAE865 TaxID=2817898 RepID=UPI001AEAC1D4